MVHLIGCKNEYCHCAMKGQRILGECHFDEQGNEYPPLRPDTNFKMYADEPDDPWKWLRWTLIIIVWAFCLYCMIYFSIKSFKIG